MADNRADADADADADAQFAWVCSSLTAGKAAMIQRSDVDQDAGSRMPQTTNSRLRLRTDRTQKCEMTKDSVCSSGGDGKALELLLTSRLEAMLMADDEDILLRNTDL